MTPDELIRDILYTDYEDNAQVVTSDNKVVTGVWLRGDNKLVIEVIEKRFFNINGTPAYRLMDKDDAEDFHKVTFDYIGGEARAKFYRIDGNEIMPY